MRWAAAVFLIVGATTCRSLPPPAPDPAVDPPAGEADCGAACARASALGCEAAEPTPEGASCEQVCREVQDSGIVRWDLECRASAQSCEETDRCER